MKWPMASDYSAILQSPAMAFVSPELQSCRIRRNAHNLPLGISGQFAVVYQAELVDGRQWAVRAFTSDRAERTERYRLIDEHLAQQQRPASLVRFDYVPRGIRASTEGRTRLYPLITMDWVTGETLFDWARHRCREGDRDRLRRAADRWPEIVGALETAEVGHGDLQHGNILLAEDDEFKLVDYDGMCVPALVGRRNLEVGMPPYQHPCRDEHMPLSLAMDRFSALFIYVALRALSAAPELWEAYVERRNYDKLLFTEDDLAQPSQSDLVRAIRSSPDGEISCLADVLFDAFCRPIDAVPPLKDIVPAVLNATPVIETPTLRVRDPSIVAPAWETETSSGEPAAGWSIIPSVTAVATPANGDVEPSASIPGSLATAPANKREPLPGVAPMLAALRENDQEKFCGQFDARLIRERKDEFASYRKLLLVWTRGRLRSAETIGLRRVCGRESVSPLPGGNGDCLVRWNWPHPRFSQTCILGLCRGVFAPDCGPKDVRLEMMRPLTRDVYEGGRGITVRADRSTFGCQVIVWATIELGFETVYSEPLVLGALRRSARGDGARR